MGEELKMLPIVVVILASNKTYKIKLGCKSLSIASLGWRVSNVPSDVSGGGNCW